MAEQISYVPPDQNAESQEILENSPAKNQDINKEIEITPEIEETVMKMVQDIHEPGIGYTGAQLKNSGDFEAILENGIITPPVFEKRKYSEKRGSHYENIREQRESYIESVKSRNPELAVWFNITGRTMDLQKGKEYEDAFWHKQKGLNKIVVLFNLAGLKELQYDIWPNSDILSEIYDDNRDAIQAELEKKLTENTFSYASEQALRGMARHGTGLPEKVYSEYGFRMRGRLNPKSFEGVIVYHPSYGILQDMHDQVKRYSNKKSKSPEEDRINKDTAQEIRTSIEDYIRQVSRWTKIMSITQRYLPIYSDGGELMWPKLMSYEEVKQFVAERDKDKDKKEEPTPETGL